MWQQEIRFPPLHLPSAILSEIAYVVSSIVSVNNDTVLLLILSLQYIIHIPLSKSMLLIKSVISANGIPLHSINK